MIKKLVPILFIFVLSLFSVGNAQKKNIHTTEGIDCSECHECAKPTKKNPCLKMCPRPFRKEDMGKKLSVNQGPNFLILNELEDLYEPVKFSHKLHADMANMANGCIACHHFTPTKKAHPPCKECHSPNIIHENINQPGLKGAYHRQCMDCHRNWSKNTDCEICHAMKAKKIAQGAQYKPIHYRQCKEPDTKVYHTGCKIGEMVTFFHNNHSELYGLSCKDCHKKDPCVRCHYQGEKSVSAIEKTADLMHHKCSACHNITDKNSCTKCHSKTEKKKFDHGQATGWAMNVYHQNLDCRSCHPKGQRIKNLNKACNSCHSGWNSENFNHSITGIALDEIHLDAECSDCHVDRQFDKKPDCSSCHEGEKTYPKDKPGKVTKKGKY